MKRYLYHPLSGALSISSAALLIGVITGPETVLGTCGFLFLIALVSIVVMFLVAVRGTYATPQRGWGVPAVWEEDIVLFIFFPVAILGCWLLGSLCAILLPAAGVCWFFSAAMTFLALWGMVVMPAQ